MLSKGGLALIGKLSGDVWKAWEVCRQDTYLDKVFGNFLLELEHCLDILPYLEATPTRHPEEPGDLRVIRYWKRIWMKADPFMGLVYDPSEGRFINYLEERLDEVDRMGQEINVPDDDLPF